MGCTCITLFSVFCTFLYRFCTTTTWKCLISRFMENVNKLRRNFISLSELGYSPLEFNSRRMANFWQSKWVGIIAIKTEGTQIHFLSDVVVESLDLTSGAETGLLSGRSQVQTRAGPTLEELRRKCCPSNDICKRLDFLVFSDNDEKPLVPSHSTLSFTILFLHWGT